MISVDRARLPRPAVLELPDDLNDLPSVDELDNIHSLAIKETVKAIAHVDDPEHHAKPDFSVYSHDDVKEALIDLFHLKCAYCESKVTSARDIEHFRPKGRIDPDTGEQTITPGYYWLAATWDNLLLSCPDCNQLKRALTRDDAGKWVFAEESTGKLDKFPLSDESKRVTSHLDDLEEEERVRLLLNPCRDDVNRHLRFDADGHIIARQVNGEISDMAKASIGVYVLWRDTLREERKARYLDMLKCSDRPIILAAGIVEHSEPDQVPEELKNTIRTSFRELEADLKQFTEDHEPYAGMASWLVKPILNELKDLEHRFEDKFGP